jgi:hypothetical protein
MPVVAEGKLFAYLKDDPKEVVLVSGFTRDVTELGHQGTGGLADWRTGGLEVMNADRCRVKLWVCFGRVPFDVAVRAWRCISNGAGDPRFR